MVQPRPASASLMALVAAMTIFPITALAPTLAMAQDAAASEASAPQPTRLRFGLVGQWTGALGYRDYQTERLFEIPVTTTIEAVPDGVTLVRRSLFDDGPDKPVWITTISLDDPALGTTTSAAWRAGRPVEVTTETMRLTAWQDADHWTIEYTTVATDGDGPAEVRVTETRDGDAILSIKDVRPIGSGPQDWRFRNQTRLTRVID